MRHKPHRNEIFYLDWVHITAKEGYYKASYLSESSKLFAQDLIYEDVGLLKTSKEGDSFAIFQRDFCKIKINAEKNFYMVGNVSEQSILQIVFLEKTEYSKIAFFDAFEKICGHPMFSSDFLSPEASGKLAEMIEEHEIEDRFSDYYYTGNELHLVFDDELHFVFDLIDGKIRKEGRRKNGRRKNGRRKA